MKKEPIGITLHQLKIFWTVAQASSFTKASKILGISATFIISTNI